MKEKIKISILISFMIILIIFIIFVTILFITKNKDNNNNNNSNNTLYNTWNAYKTEVVRDDDIIYTIEKIDDDNHCLKRIKKMVKKYAILLVIHMKIVY